jgi:hypothetical protein
MGGLEKSLEECVKDVYTGWEPALSSLMTNPGDSAMLKVLDEANTFLKEKKAQRMVLSKIGNLIDSATFVTYFSEAFPY